MRLRLTYIWHCAAAVLALLAAGGCAQVEEPGRPCPGGAGGALDAGGVTMTLRIVADAVLPQAAAATRADDLGHDETDSEVPLEDAVNVKDFGFFLFLGDGADARMLHSNTQLAASADPDEMVTGSAGVYTVSFALTRRMMTEALQAIGELPAGSEYTPSPDSQTPRRLRIAVVANPTGEDAGSFWQTDPAQWPGRDNWTRLQAAVTWGDFVEEAGRLKVAMSDIVSNTGTDMSAPGAAGSMSGVFKGLIPMFGTRVYTVTDAQLYESRPDERLWLDDLSLLRALAKVRVVDNIAGKDAAGYPRVYGGCVQVRCDEAYVLPDGALTYQNGQQVHTPRPAAATAGAPAWYQLCTPTATAGDATLMYCPEQTAGGGYPMVRIGIETAAPDVSDTGVVSPPKVTYYDVPIEQTALLRNHIYTLSVNSVDTGTPADITLSVEDWTPADFELDYNDQVTVASTLQWTPGTYLGNNTAAGRLIVSPWHDGAPVPAECTFRLSTPAGATWTAQLLTTSGEQGAFMFDTPAGWQPTATGVIDGSTQTLRIVPVNQAPAQQSTALLQVIVTLPGGLKFMEAPICSGSSYTNYTVVQNAQ